MKNNPLNPNFNLFKNKKVLITGHTGFKGSWLAFTLNTFGAEIYGLSLDIPKNAKHAYFALRIEDFLANSKSHLSDIRYTDLQDLISKVQPDFIFHLAAQALVGEAYKEPYFTFSTNILGTLNLIEAARMTQTKATLIVVTSDKCYKNLNLEKAYVESDELGGDDPYSASKAAIEIVFSSYLFSYPNFGANGIASARAGNVFGGGDWSTNRLIPDCARDVFAQKVIKIRMPNATRPWTFVHDIINGYITLGAALKETPEKYRGSWNFASGENLTVEQITKTFIGFMGYGSIELVLDNFVDHENIFLQIDPSKARTELNWQCNYSIMEALSETANWYRAQNEGQNMCEYSQHFLKNYYSR